MKVYSFERVDKRKTRANYGKVKEIIEDFIYSGGIFMDVTKRCYTDYQGDYKDLYMALHEKIGVMKIRDQVNVSTRNKKVYLYRPLEMESFMEWLLKRKRFEG